MFQFTPQQLNKLGNMVSKAALRMPLCSDTWYTDVLGREYVELEHIGWIIRNLYRDAIGY
jgi:hypothetical protein